jgi:hypothetical protein
MYAIIFILIRACEYMNERRVFDVIYFVPLRRKGANPYDDHNALAMLLGSCMGSAGEYVYGVEDLIRVLLGNTGSLAERSQADRGRSSTNRGQVCVCVCVNLNSKHTSLNLFLHRVVLILTKRIIQTGPVGIEEEEEELNQVFKENLIESYLLLMVRMTSLRRVRVCRPQHLGQM